MRTCITAGMTRLGHQICQVAGIGTAIVVTPVAVFFPPFGFFVFFSTLFLFGNNV